MIVAFSGVKYSGKDSCAAGLIQQHKFIRIGLADKLKDIISEVFSVPRLSLDDPKLKEVVLDSPITILSTHLTDLLDIVEKDGFKVPEESYKSIFTSFCNKVINSLRQLMQVVGTDILRAFVNNDMWLHYFKAKVSTVQGNIVVTDARFENERIFLKNLGAKLILVKRNGLVSSDTHVSENQLGKDSDYDVIVTNDKCVENLQSGISLWYTTKYKYATQSNN